LHAFSTGEIRARTGRILLCHYRIECIDQNLTRAEFVDGFLEQVWEPAISASSAFSVNLPRLATLPSQSRLVVPNPANVRVAIRSGTAVSLQPAHSSARGLIDHT